MAGRAQPGMDGPKPGCWVGASRPPLCCHRQHSGSLTSALLLQREEEEEEKEEEGRVLPAVCCCPAEYQDGTCQTADAHRSTSNPVAPAEVPPPHAPGASAALQPKTVLCLDVGESSQRSMCRRWWEAPRMETQGCVCVYGQRGPQGLGPCWSGPPYIYYGAVRRNLVVGVEVVEEVAVEDALEVITEDVYTDHLLSAELLQDERL